MADATRSIIGKKVRLADEIVRLVIYLAAAITVLILVGMIGYLLYRGLPVVTWNFLSTPSFSYPYENFGILANIINTLYMIVITLLFATPIGVGAAIYLSEYAKRGRLVRLVEFTTETLAGIPSIIYGLFGGAFFFLVLGVSYSILSGALTLMIMVLPVIIRTTQEAIATVPVSYREGALGIGATKWYMIRTIILPSSIEGIVTSLILSIGRIVGESAALIFTAGIAVSLPDNLITHVGKSGATLTVQLYQYATRGGAEMKYAFATAAVLLIIVLLINLLTKLVSVRLRREE